MSFISVVLLTCLSGNLGFLSCLKTELGIPENMEIVDCVTIGRFGHLGGEPLTTGKAFPVSSLQGDKPASQHPRLLGNPNI